MFKLGEISSGTLRTEDLVETFSNEFDRLLPENVTSALLEACEDWLAGKSWNEESSMLRETDGAALLADLFQALEEFCPPYVYFGASEGDGASFGFWVNTEELSRDVTDGEVLQVSSLDMVPAAYTGFVWLDKKGSITLYKADVRGGREALWSCEI